MDPEILAAAASIHTVEGRHSAYLNWRNETSRFPDAFDSPLTPSDVLVLATPFMVGDSVEEATTAS